MDLHELLRTKEPSEIFSLLLSSSKYVNENHPRYLNNSKYLVHYLLSSNEKVVECKILTLLNLISVNDNSFKRNLSCTTEIYEYGFKILYLRCSQRILQVLRLLILFCRQSQSEEEILHTQSTFNPVVNKINGNKLHLKIQDMIRTSGCLRQMCLLFILLNQGKVLWTAICECLTESCMNKIENQKQSSHILPKCLNELNKPGNEKGGIINLVISMLKDNQDNREMFLSNGGILCIHNHLLSVPEGLELLHLLIENSSSAMQKCLENNTLKKINHILAEAPNKTKSIKDLKWLHWITLITLKLSRIDSSVPCQLPTQTEDLGEKIFKKPHCVTRVNKNNLLGKDQELKVNKSFFQSDTISKPFRSKYDAISDISFNSSQDSRTFFSKPVNNIYRMKRPLKSSRESTLNVTKTSSQYSDEVSFPIHRFTPKHFSTPLKTKKDFLNYTRKFSKNNSYHNIIRTSLTRLDALNNTTTMIPYEAEGNVNEKEMYEHKVKNLVNKIFKHYNKTKISDQNISDISKNNMNSSNDEFGNHFEELYSIRNISSHRYFDQTKQLDNSINYEHCPTMNKMKKIHDLSYREENENMVSVHERMTFAIQDLTQKTKQDLTLQTEQDKNDQETVYKFYNYNTINIKNEFREEYLDTSKRLDAKSIPYIDISCQSKSHNPELSSHRTVNHNMCKNKCKELQMLINKLQMGICHYGLNFHIIGKLLWPEDKTITPSYLQKVFLTHIVQK